MMKNQQPPEKRIHDEEGVLEVFAVFHTIQGEGPFTGQPAVFIRLSGCNLQCPGCDTDYTSSRFRISPSSLVSLVREQANPGHLVVITGGEPFRQDLYPLVIQLLNAGYRVQIETNGTFYQDLPYGRITIVCSPKTGRVHPLLPINAFKYVLDASDVSEEDGLPNHALGHPAQPQLARPPKDFSGAVYLQPMDTGFAKANEVHLAAAIKSVMKFGYTLCLQTHKIINME